MCKHYSFLGIAISSSDALHVFPDDILRFRFNYIQGLTLKMSLAFVLKSLYIVTFFVTQKVLQLARSLKLENKKNITVKLIILLPISRILTMCTTNWKTTVLWFYVKGTRKHNIEFIGQAVSYFE